MGSEDYVISDDEYDLDLSPPEVEELPIIKKQSPPVARSKKIFTDSDISFSTYKEAKKYFSLHRMKYK